MTDETPAPVAPAAPAPEAAAATPMYDPTGWVAADNHLECPQCNAKENVKRPWTLGAAISEFEHRCTKCGRWLGVV